MAVACPAIGYFSWLWFCFAHQSSPVEDQRECGAFTLAKLLCCTCIVKLHEPVLLLTSPAYISHSVQLAVSVTVSR
jgi:hypothetical protein